MLTLLSESPDGHYQIPYMEIVPYARYRLNEMENLVKKNEKVLRDFKEIYIKLGEKIKYF